MDRVRTLKRRFSQTSSHIIAALPCRIMARGPATVGTGGVEVVEANEKFLQQTQAGERPVANGAGMDLPDATRAAGDVARAQDPTAADVFAGSLVDSGLDPGDLVTVGLALRDGGRASAAAIVLQDVIAKWPTVVAAYYELAFLRRLEGRHLDAVRTLLAATVVDQSDLRVMTFLVHMLHAVGAHAEAKRYHDAVMPRAGDYAWELTLLQEFGSYLRDWPLDAALLLLERVQRAYGWLDSKQVADRVIAALDERQPLALVRLGDGEGSCISLGEDDERRFPALYAKNRGELTAMWFGEEFEADQTGFTRLSRRIVDIALRCDIVGMPYEGWLTHEYRISSARGIPSLVNVLRAFEAVQLCAPPRPMLCSQLVHTHLQSSGELERIIRHAGRLTLISCIPELPDLLRQHFGVDHIEFHRVPGERGSAAALGTAAVEGNHYPETYERLQEQLRCPHHAHLFLIAGGILGKFYAQTVREFGGVALDIGSVADAWAGKSTRPGVDLSNALAERDAGPGATAQPSSEP